MSNYPNMSHCMFENTSLAMQQIIVEFEDHDLQTATLTRREQAALRDMVLQCEKFLEYAEANGYA